MHESEINGGRMNVTLFQQFPNYVRGIRIHITDSQVTKTLLMSGNLTESAFFISYREGGGDSACLA
jgi:hypothetical protein